MSTDLPATPGTYMISWDEIVHSVFSSCPVSQPVTIRQNSPPPSNRWWPKFFFSPRKRR